MDHKTFMRNTHTYDDCGDESKGPRLTHYSLCKGAEVKDPMAPQPEETGKTIDKIDHVFAYDVAKTIFLNYICSH